MRQHGGKFGAAFIAVLLLVAGGFVFTAVTSEIVVKNLNPACLANNFILTPALNLAEDIGNELVNTTIGGDGLKITEELFANAAIIYTTGKATPGIDDETIVLALASALGESTLENKGWQGERNDHNSLGIFQMQFGPDFQDEDGKEYWGTPAQLMNPFYQAQRFYQEYHDEGPYDGMRPIDIMHEILEFRVDLKPQRAEWFDEAKLIFEILEASNSTSEELSEDKSVAVIGDSLAVGANTYMFDDLAAAGYSVVRVDAQGGRTVDINTTDTYTSTTSQTGPTLSDNQLLVSGVTAIERQKESGFDPKYWIVMLGTNDIGFLSDDPVEAKNEALRRIVTILDTIGTTKEVLWLTVWSASQPEKAAVFNQTLAELTSTRDNLLVGDWAAMVEQNPDWLVDHVHYSPEGVRQQSSFLGKAAGFLGSGLSKATGIMSQGMRIFSAVPALPGGLSNCNPVTNVLGRIATGLTNLQGEPVLETTPIELVSNPRLAEAIVNLPNEVGGPILYGAAREKWIDAGRKGNFGHGDPEEWYAQTVHGQAYRSLDCSGLMNVGVFRAYGIRVSACSHDFTNLWVNGNELTVPVMHDRIDNPLYLRPGDFIVKHNQGCLGGDEMNHIVMVLGLTATNSIVTAESVGGDVDGPNGYIVRERDAAWFNTNWPDLVVSRWIGPGAIALTEGSAVIESV